MQAVLTVTQIKELDRAAITQRGISSLELMERAAHAVAGAAAALAREGCPAGEGPRVAVLCGPGNNGGDGIAAARLLMEQGCRVRAFLVGQGEKMTPDARAMQQWLAQAGGELEQFCPSDSEQLVWISACRCVIDALFGVGLRRAVTGDFLAAVKAINHCSCPVLACDIPSGMEGDTGQALGEAVRATVTVTFTRPKPGLYLGQGAACAGRIEVADIGIPDELLLATGGLVQAVGGESFCLPRRPRAGHKGDFGKIFILAGSRGYTGAPVLAARGALRTGAGLVWLGVPESVYPIVAAKCDEAMPFPLPEDEDELLQRARGCDVALIGPGLGQGPRVQGLVAQLLAQLEIPVVLDADGINALCGHIDSLDKRSAPTVLTPHDGEFARLTGCSLPIADRLGAATAFAKERGCILVLKGHRTITAAPDGRAWINLTGNPGMAKGGAGDVLAGMIAALWGQGHLSGSDLAARTAAAVSFHGQAGDCCAHRLGEYAMLAQDIVETLPEVLRRAELGDGQLAQREMRCL